MDTTPSSRYRTLGEIVNGPRDSEELGKFCLAVFPGIDGELQVPVWEADLLAAGVDTSEGSCFSAIADHEGVTPEEIAPEAIESLLTRDQNRQAIKLI